LIALGESIVLVGATLSRLLESSVTWAEAGAFLLAVGGSAGLWWLYFDRSADEAARVSAASADPGRIGRTAYHLIHPVMVAGIIVVAAADVGVRSQPGAVGVASTGWLVLGGTALFIAGHAAFKFAVWRVVPWTRLAALVVAAAARAVRRCPRWASGCARPSWSSRSRPSTIAYTREAARRWSAGGKTLDPSGRLATVQAASRMPGWLAGPAGLSS
jgi:hypothetical protein